MSTTCRRDAHNRAKKAPRVKPQPATKAKIDYLKQFLSPIHYGYEKWEGPTLLGPRPVFSTKSVNNNLKKGWARPVTNERLRQHHEMGMPCFYTMSLKNSLLLVNVDHDVGKGHGSSSTTKDAQRLADAIQEVLASYPGVTYDEPSTHHEGIHQYLLLVNEDNGQPLDRARVDDAMKMLAQVVRAIKKQTNSPVKDVEIKGHAARVEWSGPEDRNQHGGRYRVVTKFGQLAKVPWLSRDGDLDRLKNTTRLTYYDILDLHRQYVGHDTSKHYPVQKPRRDERTAEHRDDTAAQPAKGGSCCQLTKASQDGMTHWEKRFLARGWNNLKTRGDENRSIVMARDFAIARAIVAAIQRLLRPGEPFRQSRIEALWNKMYQDGVVDRAFCCHRWAVIRNRMANAGLLFCQDRRYWFTVDGGPGTGRAMIWRLGMATMQDSPPAPSRAVDLSAGLKAVGEEDINSSNNSDPSYTSDALAGPHASWRPLRIMYWRYGPSPDVKFEAPHHLAA